MRYLILPDVHDKIRRANQIIEHEPHGHLLLLGDFFDDFRTGVTDAADTARQVKRWLNASNTTCLLGNHEPKSGSTVFPLSREVVDTVQDERRKSPGTGSPGG
jgi:metallophosphoesterase superfamily enzyme